MLSRDMVANLHQIGCTRLADLPGAVRVNS